MDNLLASLNARHPKKDDPILAAQYARPVPAPSPPPPSVSSLKQAQSKPLPTPKAAQNGKGKRFDPKKKIVKPKKAPAATIQTPEGVETVSQGVEFTVGSTSSWADDTFDQTQDESGESEYEDALTTDGTENDSLSSTQMDDAVASTSETPVITKPLPKPNPKKVGPKNGTHDQGMYVKIMHLIMLCVVKRGFRVENINARVFITLEEAKRNGGISEDAILLVPKDGSVPFFLCEHSKIVAVPVTTVDLRTTMSLAN